MYQSHFQLHDRPFASVANPDHYFPAASIEQAREVIALNLERASGATTLVGAVGSGKTLLCQLIANQFCSSLPVSMIPGSELRTTEDLLQAILHQLDLPHHGQDESELRRTLSNHVTGQSCLNGIVLIIDEADRLSVELLEEVRGLTNLVKDGQPCVRLLLAGSESLEETLGTSVLESLNQRVVGRLFLENFTQDETRDYVRARIQTVGGEADSIFTADAIQNIYKATNGVPRLVNQICDHTLLMASVANVHEVDGRLVEEAWADLQQIPVPTSALRNIGTENSSEVVIEFGSLDEDDHSQASQSDAESIVVDFGDEEIAVEETSEQVQIEFGDSVETEDSPELEITIGNETIIEDAANSEVSVDDGVVEVVIEGFDESDGQSEQVVIEEIEIEVKDAASSSEIAIEISDNLTPTIEDDIEEDEESGVELPETDELSQTDELEELPETDELAESDEPDELPETELPETDELTSYEPAAEAAASDVEEGLTIDQATNPFGAQFGGASNEQPREVESYLEGADFPEPVGQDTEVSEPDSQSSSHTDQGVATAAALGATAMAVGALATNEENSPEAASEDAEEPASEAVIVEEFASAESLARDGLSEVSTTYSPQLSEQLSSAQPGLKMHDEYAPEQDTETSADAAVEEEASTTQADTIDEELDESEFDIADKTLSETVVQSELDAELDEEPEAAQDTGSKIEAEIRNTDRLVADLDEIEQEVSDLQEDYDSEVEVGADPTAESEPSIGVAEESLDGISEADDVVYIDESLVDVSEVEDSGLSLSAATADEGAVETVTDSEVSDIVSEAESFDPSDDPVLPEDGVEEIVSGMTASVTATLAATATVSAAAVAANSEPEFESESDERTPAAHFSSEAQLAEASESGDGLQLANDSSVSSAAISTVEAVAEPQVDQVDGTESSKVATAVESSTAARVIPEVESPKQKKVFSTLFSKMRRN